MAEEKKETEVLTSPVTRGSFPSETVTCRYPERRPLFQLAKDDIVGCSERADAEYKVCFSGDMNGQVEIDAAWPSPLVHCD